MRGEADGGNALCGTTRVEPAESNRIPHRPTCSFSLSLWMAEQVDRFQQMTETEQEFFSSDLEMGNPSVSPFMKPPRRS